MSGQIKTNEAGFQQAIDGLMEQMQMWEQQNNELLGHLDELGEHWKGVSSRNYMEGSECIYANSVQRQRDLSQLRTDMIKAYRAIEFFDLSHAKSLITNIFGGK